MESAGCVSDRQKSQGTSLVRKNIPQKCWEQRPRSRKAPGAGLGFCGKKGRGQTWWHPASMLQWEENLGSRDRVSPGIWTWPQLTPYLTEGLESQGWVWRCRVILSVPYSYANKRQIAKICITNPCLMGAKVPPPLGFESQNRPTLTTEGKAVWEFS